MKNLYGIVSLWLWCVANVAAGAQTANGTKPPAPDTFFTGVLHSAHMASGVPLGGIGAGGFEWRSDGTAARFALFGSHARPGAERDYPGCFAAVWTRAGDKTDARVLALQSGYALPHAAMLDYDGLYPQALCTVPGSELPLNVGLRVFTPLVPHDIRNSSFPAACYLFQLKNPLAVSVEVSVVLSWEGAAGLDGQDGTNGVEAREIPSGEGFFGFRLGQPAPATPKPDAVLPDEIALLALPPRPQAVVHTALWNAQNTPAWWADFQRTGDVNDAPSGPVRGDGAARPAGAVSVRLTLKPGDYVDIPFAVAWYARRSHDGAAPYYQRLWPDAPQTARALLNDWISLFALTEEWQKRLTYANLPVWMSHRLVNSLAPLSSHSVHTRDGRVTLLSETESLSSADALPNEDALAQLAGFSGLLTFYPDLAAQMLTQELRAQQPDGTMVLPAGEASLPAALGPPPVPAAAQTQSDTPQDTPPLPARQPLVSSQRTAATSDGQSAFLLRLTQYTLQTGDTLLAKTWQAQTRRACDALLDIPNENLPPASTSLKQAALRAVLRLQDAAGDTNAAAHTREALQAVEAYRQQKQWNGDFYAIKQNESSISTLDQQIGLWAENALDCAPPVPDANNVRALQNTMVLHTRTPNAFPFGPPLRLLPDGTLPPGDPAAARISLPGVLLGGAALALWLDRPEQAVALWQNTDVQRNTYTVFLPMSPPADKSHQAVPGSAPASVAPAAIARELTGHTLGAMADWNLLAALEGLAWDGVAQRLTLAPNIPGTWRKLTAPAFLPVFWARLEFTPLAHGGVTTFRLDRITTANTGPVLDRLQGGAELIVKSLRVLGPTRIAAHAPATPPSAHVSLGTRPLGAHTEQNAAGDLILTFDTPLHLTAGDRLEIDVH